MVKPVIQEFILQDRDGSKTTLFYDAHASRLYNADGTEFDFEGALGKAYDSKHFCTAYHTSKEAPVGKTKAIRRLKIQMGFACNFHCTYCNQRSQTETMHSNTKDARAFLAKLENWFDGGEDGKGKGVRFEFWGGEPFVYWKKLQVMVPFIRERYPNAEIILITNGSMFTEERIQWIIDYDVIVGISHDGPGQHLRGPDPLADEEMLKWIKRLFEVRGFNGNVSFNCVLTNQNYKFADIHTYIANKLGVPQVPMSTEELVLAEDPGSMLLSPVTKEDHDRIRWSLFEEMISMVSPVLVGTVQQKIDEFFESLRLRRPVESLWQKCGMDRPDVIAVDLKGNILTCQNTIEEKMFIGHVDKIEEAKVTTATHFLKRPWCYKCPVVQLCKGSCMYLEGEKFKQTCANSKTYNLAVLMACMFFMTGKVLVEVITHDGMIIGDLKK